MAYSCISASRRDSVEYKSFYIVLQAIFACSVWPCSPLLSLCTPIGILRGLFNAYRRSKYGTIKEVYYFFATNARRVRGVPLLQTTAAESHVAHSEGVREFQNELPPTCFRSTKGAPWKSPEYLFLLSRREKSDPTAYKILSSPTPPRERPSANSRSGAIVPGSRTTSSRRRSRSSTSPRG